MKKLLFILNARSGKAQIKNKLLSILDIFIKAGYQVEVHTTQHRLDAKDVVIARGTDKDLIVCSGGDGTLNETICGLMELQIKPLLGYIPTGTTNDFAASLKLSKNMIDAANTVIYGSPFTCDVGLFDNRYFSYVVAFGIFTDVPYVTPQQAKNVLGHQAYLLEGVKRLSNIKPSHMIFEYEGGQIEGDFIYGMISNATSVGGFKNLTGNDVEMDDGLFEVMLVKMPKNPFDLGDIASSLLLKDNNTDYIYKLKVNEIHVISEEPTNWVIDGEFGGSKSEITIKNVKRAITIQV